MEFEASSKWAKFGAKKKKRSGLEIGGGAGERNDIDYMMMMIFIQDDLS